MASPRQEAQASAIAAAGSVIASGRMRVFRSIPEATKKSDVRTRRKRKSGVGPKRRARTP